MHIAHMTCHGFRCLKKLDFRPGPGLNIIRGRNAQGKTSVLEALLYVATTRSHRTNQDSDLVRHGQERFSIRIEGRRTDREIAIETVWWRGAKRFKVNGVAQTRLSDILGKIYVVFFGPEDIQLVKGSAAVRRRFIDATLSQLYPAYLRALQDYRRVLRQRNEALRTRHASAELLAPWDAQLARYGKSLMRQRSMMCEEIDRAASETYGRIAPGEQLRVAYRPDVPKDRDFEALLEECRETDMKRKQTMRGPHRDEMDVLIGAEAARNFGSQGQQKSAALALRMAELDFIRAKTGSYPILLLDEVLAELDQTRTSRLLEWLDGTVQCILTTTEISTEKTDLFPGATNFYIEDGELRPIAESEPAPERVVEPAGRVANEAR